MTKWFGWSKYKPTKWLIDQMASAKLQFRWKCKDDQKASWSNGQSIKWPVDQMASQSNGKMFKWQVDQMARCSNGKLIKGQVDQMTSRSNGKSATNCPSPMSFSAGDVTSRRNQWLVLKPSGRVSINPKKPPFLSNAEWLEAQSRYLAHLGVFWLHWAFFSCIRHF